VVHIPDDRLSAFIDGDVLDANGLIASEVMTRRRFVVLTAFARRG
jgi:hypothetical protein